MIKILKICQIKPGKSLHSKTPMTNPKIVVYGTSWCSDCFRARRFLDDHKIIYQWINIDKDKTGEQTVLKINDGKRNVPTIIFGDGIILIEPSNAELALKLGFPIT
jgi:glutaredoxin